MTSEEALATIKLLTEDRSPVMTAGDMERRKWRDEAIERIERDQEIKNLAFQAMATCFNTLKEIEQSAPLTTWLLSRVNAICEMIRIVGAKSQH